MLVVPESLINEVLTDVVEMYLKPKFIELGMNASGQWLRSLEVITSLNSGEIWGMDYTQYLVNGRRPGNRPPITPLVEWVKNKFGYVGQEATSTAFAIANKIAKEGTEYYPDGTDLLEVLNSREVMEFINNRIEEYVVKDAKLRFERIFKETLITI